MNQFLDTSEVLKLQETANGHILWINNKKPQKILVENGEIQNDLTEKQLKFVKDYI